MGGRAREWEEEKWRDRMGRRTGEGLKKMMKLGICW